MRFKVGDIVRVVVITQPDDFDVLYEEGTIVIAEEDGVEDNEGNFGDYDVDTGHPDWTYVCKDWQLAPLNPPAEPSSIVREEETHA